MEIYFDNAATTEPCEACLSVAEKALRQYGNPSSLHGKGLEAENIIKTATKQIKKALSAPRDGIVFTSGGTEANNCAIFSGAYLPRVRGRRIITTEAEHPSVLACVKELERRGFETVYLTVGTNGHVSMDELYDSVNGETKLVSIAHVNSETGTVQPISDLVKAVRKKNPYTLFHCDAVQAFGKMKVCTEADYVTLSAHKIHGLKGTGALYVKNGVQLLPLLYGGGQQQGLRSGTENVAGIAAFGEAVNAAFQNMPKNYQNALEIKQYIINHLVGDGVVINGDNSQNASPYILNISILGVRSEVMLHALENEGIYVSAGSACSSRQKISSVLSAYNLPPERSGSAIRLSFSAFNTLTEAEYFIHTIKSLIPSLRKYSGIKDK